MNRLLRLILVLASFSTATAAYAQSFKPLDNPAPQERLPGKVLVQQFLSFQCGHCLNLEPHVENWLDHKAEDVVFERMPVVWQPEQANAASFYGLAKVMKNNREITNQQLNDINTGLFALHFMQKKPLNVANTYPFFQAAGIESAEAYGQRLFSIPVMQQRNRSSDLTRQYRIASVPSFVVDGRYLVSFDTLQGPRQAENLLQALEQTIEHARNNP